MLRCKECGIRLAAPSCPTHGAVEAPPAASVDLPPVELPGYRVLRTLGAGGFGAVFACERGGETVAVKVSRPDVPLAAERLESEGAALRAIGPPHAPAVTGEGVLPDGARW